MDKAFHATTSAALKLLRRRRMLLKFGLSDLEPAVTTAATLLVIHESLGVFVTDDLITAVTTPEGS